MVVAWGVQSLHPNMEAPILSMPLQKLCNLFNLGLYCHVNTVKIAWEKAAKGSYEASLQHKKNKENIEPNSVSSSNLLYCAL